MNTLPHTSEQHYITGKAALNVPNPDGSFADWHFDEVFLSGRGKIRIAGKDMEPTLPMLGSYGIRECGDTLRRFGLAIPDTEKVYTANHIRAILDMVLTSIAKKKLPSHVVVDEFIDSESELAELQSKVQELKTKISDQITLSLLVQWEQTSLKTSMKIGSSMVL
jgi:hypothetical protein